MQDERKRYIRMCREEETERQREIGLRSRARPRLRVEALSLGARS